MMGTWNERMGPRESDYITLIVFIRSGFDSVFAAFFTRGGGGAIASAGFQRWWGQNPLSHN